MVSCRQARQPVVAPISHGGAPKESRSPLAHYPSQPTAGRSIRPSAKGARDIAAGQLGGCFSLRPQEGAIERRIALGKIGIYFEQLADARLIIRVIWQLGDALVDCDGEPPSNGVGRRRYQNVETGEISIEGVG
jgi:hypothetical protein